MPGVIEVAGLLIPTAKLAFVLFVVLSSLIVGRISRRLGAQESRLVKTIEHAILIGLVGARVAFAVENPQVYRSSPLSILYFWQPGYAFWVGFVIAACYAVWIVWRGKARRQSATILLTGISLPLAAYLITIQTMGWLGPAGQLRVGDPVPPLALVNLDGKPVELSALRGHPVILNIWATWCYACRQEMPLLNRTYTANKDRGIKMIGINLAEPTARVHLFLDHRPVAYPIWLDPPSATGTSASPTSAFFARVGGVGLPTTLFIGKSGIIRGIRVGEITRPALAIELRRLGLSWRAVIRTNHASS